MTAPAQARLNLLEWVSAGEDLLRNVGQFGPAYDHVKVERFQKAVTAAAGNVVDDQQIRPVRVDGFWGAEVVGAMKVLLSLPPSDPFPSVYPNTYRYRQWNDAGTQAWLAEHFAGRRALILAVTSPQGSSSPVPNATTAASNEAQAAVAAAHEPLTAPPAPETPPVRPPPDEAAPGPRPPSPRDPLPPPPPGGGRLAPRGGTKTENTFPWVGVGLFVLVVGIGWFAISKRRSA